MSESLSDTFRRLSEAATDVTAHRGKVAGFRDNRSVEELIAWCGSHREEIAARVAVAGDVGE